MYTNIGLGLIARRYIDSNNDLYKTELTRLICPYAGKQLQEEQQKIKEYLVIATKIFLDESIITNQHILSLFSEWLSNGRFRQKCLNNKSLIKKGSGVLEVFPKECVEIPTLQLIYNEVDWVCEIPEDVLTLSRQTAKENVSKILEHIYKKY